MEYWEKRYAEKNTPWQLNSYSPAIVDFVKTYSNKNINILIPGCGNSKEAEELLKLGFKNIYVIDISKTAIKNIKKENILPENQIFEGDFFNFNFPLKFDLILEQTFFCAINPSLRDDYVKKMFKILNDHGILAGLLFNVNFENNPPYGGNIETYKNIFSSNFEVLTLEPSINSIEARKGSELFFKFKKK